MGAAVQQQPPARRMDSSVSVGRIESKYFTYGSLILGAATIIFCYVGSIYMDYVPIWLPMISDTFVYPPMSYVSRLGMITTACMLFVNSLMFYFFLESESLGGRKAQDSYGMAVALISVLGLGTLIACNEDQNGTIHGTAAVIFFAMQLVYMWMSTLRLHRDQNDLHMINPTSLKVKFSICVVTTVLLIAFGLMSSNWGKWGTWIAVEEWTGVFLILIFNATYAWEFQDSEYIGSMSMTPPTSGLPVSQASAHAMLPTEYRAYSGPIEDRSIC